MVDTKAALPAGKLEFFAGNLRSLAIRADIDLCCRNYGFDPQLFTDTRSSSICEDIITDA